MNKIYQSTQSISAIIVDYQLNSQLEWSLKTANHPASLLSLTSINYLFSFKPTFTLSLPSLLSATLTPTPTKNNYQTTCRNKTLKLKAKWSDKTNQAVYKNKISSTSCSTNVNSTKLRVISNKAMSRRYYNNTMPRCGKRRSSTMILLRWKQS